MVSAKAVAALAGASIVGGVILYEATKSTAVTKGVVNVTISAQIVSQGGSGVSSVTNSLVTGIIPLDVAFASAVSGGVGPYSYSWSFGATTSTASNTFNSIGSSTATCDVTDSLGNVGSASIGISAYAPLTVSVSPANVTQVAPATITFTATVGGGILPYSYRWNFGDNGSGSVNPASHTYTIAGGFTSTCTVTDGIGNMFSASSSVLIESAAASLSVTASASPASGTAPLSVNFSSLPSGGSPPYTFSWVFGDGGTSTLQNPSHVFQNAGAFTASVQAHDSVGALASANAGTINVTVSSTTITVLSIDQNNSPVTGLYIALGQNGNLLVDGYTPVSFNGLIAGNSYELTAENIGGYIFTNWSVPSYSVSNPLQFTASSTPQSFTAQYLYNAGPPVVSFAIVGPSTTLANSYFQYQSQVYVALGSNPVGLAVAWYVDNVYVATTDTGPSGGQTNLGIGYYAGAGMAPGTHSVYGVCEGVQSNVITTTFT